MSTAHAAELVAAFRSTLHPDPAQRAAAESFLAQSPIALATLLDLVAADSVDAAVQQAAAVYLKNRVARAWDVEVAAAATTTTTTTAPDTATPISDEDRAAVRARILPVLLRVHATAALREQMLTALRTIVAFDYPSYWSEYPQLVLDMLRSDDLVAVKVGLWALRELVQAYRWRSAERRASLNPVIEHVFPLLADIAARVVDALPSQQGPAAEDAADMLVVIAKSYFGAIQYFMPPVLLDANSMQRWSEIFVKTIRAPDHLPAPAPGTLSATENDPRATSRTWKARKWAMHCLNRVFTRYGNPALLGGDAKTYMEFAEWYVTTVAPAIIETYLGMVDGASQGRYIASRCRCLISNYLTDAVKHKTTWKLVKPHVDAMLVQRWIFPELCWAESLEALWQEDPVEFVHRNADPVEDYRSPTSAAIQLLLSLVEDRKKVTLMPTLQFINQVLLVDRDTAPDARDPRRKSGAMAMMSHMAKLMMSKKSPVRGQMEEFLTVHILPELASPYGFMRAYACQVMEAFAELEFKDTAVHMQFLQHILSCLEDKELPVRVRAALALHPLVQHDALREAMAQHLTGIMKAFLKLTNDIDLDTLGDVTEEFVGVYAEQLTPVAVELCDQLRDTALSMLADTIPATTGPKQDRDWDEVADRIMAAQSILRTVFTLVTSLDEEANPQLFPAIERSLLPLHKFVLEHAVIDLYEELFEIIEGCIFTQRTVTPAAWELFVSIMRAFDLRGDDFIDTLVPCLDNYVSFGAQAIMANPEVLQQFIKVAETIMNPLNERITESDRVWGCRLIESLLLNCRGGLDQYLGRFIELAGGYLTNGDMAEKHVKTDVFRMYLLEIWINALLYNPAATLATLNQHQWAVPFMQMWFQNMDKLPRVHDKRLQLFALCALAESDPSHIPAELQAMFGDVGRAMIQVLRTYPEAYAKRQEQEDLLGDGDSDSDDSDLAGADVSFDLDAEGGDEDGDVMTEEREYLEYLALRASEGFTGDDDDDADVLYEELNFESPLDKTNLWVKFRDTMQSLQAHKPDVYGALVSAWSAEDRQVADAALQSANATEATESA